MPTATPDDLEKRHIPSQEWQTFTPITLEERDEDKR